MDKIKLLDCTLRDGGYVNNFKFGSENIEKIALGLSKTNVDFIELGFLKDGNHDANQTLFNYVSEAEKYVSKVNTNQEFTLMIRPDWYDISKLEKCTGKIKNLRFAFHFEDLDLTIKQAEIARNNGYNVMLNPVSIMSYSDNTLEIILDHLNKFQPKVVNIVDTLGAMFPDDLKHIFELFNNGLDKEISIGVHLHENLSLALGLALNFIEMIGDSRTAYIDSSILGMGRIPGNLCTELIMNTLNLKKNCNFSLSSVYELIDSPISEIRKNIPWGYLPAYAITGVNKMHRSYAEYLMTKSNLGLIDIDNILKQISEDNREDYNENLIESLYQKYCHKI